MKQKHAFNKQTNAKFVLAADAVAAHRITHWARENVFQFLCRHAILLLPKGSRSERVGESLQSLNSLVALAGVDPGVIHT
jgi:hypothetical protein